MRSSRGLPDRQRFGPLCLTVVSCIFLDLLITAAVGFAQTPVPDLTAPVNDFANVIDQDNENALDSMIRTLERTTGDTLVVATVSTIEPYADIREYAVRLFENRGRGIGRKGKDNGVLVVLAVRERQVRVEVGYDLEQFITDGFAGSTSRDYMVPAFRQDDYGGGLRAGVARIVGRIAEGRGVSLDNLPRPTRQAPSAAPGIGCSPVLLIFLVIIILVIANSRGPGGGFRPRRRRRWGTAPWSGWSSGVGPFGGGFGGGGAFGGGGGFGGGFGGFGGGRSGGGGGGAGW